MVFHHYTDFIYPHSHNIDILHRMLHYEPDAASRYSSFIIQDMIQTNATEVGGELTHHFIHKLVR